MAGRAGRAGRAQLAVYLLVAVIALAAHGESEPVERRRGVHEPRNAHWRPTTYIRFSGRTPAEK